MVLFTRHTCGSTASSDTQTSSTRRLMKTPELPGANDVLHILSFASIHFAWIEMSGSARALGIDFTPAVCRMLLNALWSLPVVLSTDKDIQGTAQHSVDLPNPSIHPFLRTNCIRTSLVGNNQSEAALGWKGGLTWTVSLDTCMCVTFVVQQMCFLELVNWQGVFPSLRRVHYWLIDFGDWL